MKISTGFYRAIVRTTLDSQMGGRVGVYIPELMASINPSKAATPSLITANDRNVAVDYIYARPTCRINKKADNYKKYKTKGGTFDIPSKDDHIAVFFLNNNIDECYYLPDVGLPFDGEIPVGKNLPSGTILDFLDLSRRSNVAFREFGNGDVIGFDYNEDTRTLFINFDNGSSIQFASPNKLLGKDDFVLGSHPTKPSLLDIIISRKDSLFASVFKLRSNKHKSAEFLLQTRLETDSENNPTDSDYNDGDISKHSLESGVSSSTTNDSTKTGLTSSYINKGSGLSSTATLEVFSNEKKSGIRRVVNFIRGIKENLSFADELSIGNDGVEKTDSSILNINKIKKESISKTKTQSFDTESYESSDTDSVELITSEDELGNEQRKMRASQTTDISAGSTTVRQEVTTNNVDAMISSAESTTHASDINANIIDVLTTYNSSIPDEYPTLTVSSSISNSNINYSVESEHKSAAEKVTVPPAVAILISPLTVVRSKVLFVVESIVNSEFILGFDPLRRRFSIVPTVDFIISNMLLVSSGRPNTLIS